MSTERYDGGSSLSLRYHPTEAWLEVRRGEVVFFSAGGRPYRLTEGMALSIPRGEVYRAEAGPEGAEYRVWAPADISPESFSAEVSPELLTLIEQNRKIPGIENEKDRGSAEAASLLEAFAGEDLRFRAGDGKVVKERGAFLERDAPNPPIVREAAPSVQILHATEASVLLSTVVYTRPLAGGPQKAVTNVRLFVKEDREWRCSAWLNYPEPQAL